MERITESIQRDLFARMKLRIAELERENTELHNRLADKENSWTDRPRRWKYMTEAERQEARRKTWRESQRRRKNHASATCSSSTPS